MVIPKVKGVNMIVSPCSGAKNCQDITGEMEYYLIIVSSVPVGHHKLSRNSEGR